MAQALLKEIEIGSKNALLKKRIITHYIYNGSSTITDLAKELDLSVPTVTKFISEMCEEGYINDYGKLETSGGRHPSIYGLNPESGYFIGIDIKKFAINIALINFKGDMLELKLNIPYKFDNTPEALEELCKLIRNFIKQIKITPEKIMNICINISGRVNPESGYSFSMFNFSERPLAEVLSLHRQRHTRHDLRRIYERKCYGRKKYHFRQYQLGTRHWNNYRRENIHGEIGLFRRIRTRQCVRQRNHLPLW